MAQFKQRFHGRYHSPGQLIAPSELIEMQQLQYKTYSNIEADRYGLNPDGSFTPHVISGLKPSVVAGQHQIKIGRGHGWITNSLSNTDGRIPVILEDDLFVDLPAPDGSHPYWCHVMLECLGAGKNATYGNATVATKGIDGITRNISSPLYFQMTTATAVLSQGTPAASPECDVIGAPNILPIATVYIGTSDSGAIPAGQLYDVRWFAPGHGSFWIHDKFATPGVDMNCGSDWRSIYWNRVTSDLVSTGFLFALNIPNRSVFLLLPETSECALASYESHVSANGIIAPAAIVEVPPTPTVYSSPLRRFDIGWQSLDLSSPAWDANDIFNVKVTFGNKF